MSKKRWRKDWNNQCKRKKKKEKALSTKDKEVTNRGTIIIKNYQKGARNDQEIRNIRNYTTEKSEKIEANRTEKNENGYSYEKNI